MIVYVFLKPINSGTSYAMARIYSPSDVEISEVVINPSATCEHLAMLAIRSVLPQKPQHILLVVEGDSCVLRNGINKIMDDIGLVMGTTTWYVETYPNDFTMGSFACNTIEKLIAKIEDSEVMEGICKTIPNHLKNISDALYNNSGDGLKTQHEKILSAIDDYHTTATNRALAIKKFRELVAGGNASSMVLMKQCVLIQKDKIFVVKHHTPLNLKYWAWITLDEAKKLIKLSYTDKSALNYNFVITIPEDAKPYKISSMLFTKEEIEASFGRILESMSDVPVLIDEEGKEIPLHQILPGDIAYEFTYIQHNKRFWASWFSENTAECGMTVPPFKTWISGSRYKFDDPSKTEYSICAVIDVPDEDALWELVKIHYPDYAMRLIAQKDLDWEPPIDRFPK